MLRFATLLLTVAMALVLTGGLSWFALRNYRLAAPIAQENLRGQALTMAAAMEGVASHDPSLASLNSFQNDEIAYAALIAADGKILFHTNSDLVDSYVPDQRYQPVLASGILGEERIQLGTGETVYEFQTPVHLSAQTCILRLALHTWRAENVMRTAKQGITVTFSLLAVGWILGITIIWMLRRQAWQQRQTARQQELARLGEVGAVLAHEIRNPLAGIKGYGQLLEERLPDGRERGFASLIVKETQRLEGLARDILLYSRSDSIAAAPCQLASVVATVFELLIPQVQEQDIDLSCDIPDDLIVPCQEESLHQVLLNVLTNSLQASPTAGKIRVTAQRKGKWAEIKVADNGPGISVEMRDVLFEPFSTSKARGAGLGLAVCRKIVEGCGGSIMVRNVPDGGAECIILLPAILANGGSA